MADAPVVNIGENSPEQIAHKLMHEIARIEGKVLHQSPGSGQAAAPRKWVLDTYAECLDAVRGERSYPKPKDQT